MAIADLYMTNAQFFATRCRIRGLVAAKPPYTIMDTIDANQSCWHPCDETAACLAGLPCHEDNGKGGKVQRILKEWKIGRMEEWMGG